MSTSVRMGSISPNRHVSRVPTVASSVTRLASVFGVAKTLCWKITAASNTAPPVTPRSAPIFASRATLAVNYAKAPTNRHGFLYLKKTKNLTLSSKHYQVFLN